MARPYAPPAETVASGTGRSLPKVSVAIMACALSAALLGSEAMLDWAEALPVHPISDFVVAAAAQWRETTQALGVGDLSAGARKLFRAVQDYRA